MQLAPPASLTPRRRRLTAAPATVAAVVTLGVLGLLLLYPLLMLIYSSFRVGAPGLPGEFTLQGYANAYRDSMTYVTWGNALLIALQVTALSLAIAIFFAWIVTRTDTPGRHLVLPMMALVLATPPIYFALGWAMLGHPRAGALNQLAAALLPLGEPLFNTNSWAGIVFVMTLIAVPFKCLLLVGVFRTMDRAVEEAGRMAGASRVRTMLLVTLPLLAPAILGISIMSFMRGVQALDVPLFLGLPAKIYVLSTRIFDYVANYSPARYAEAGALSISLVLAMLALLAVQQRLLGERDFTTISGRGYRPEIIALGKWKYVCLALVVLYGVLALGLPLAQMLVGSLQPIYGRYTWNWTLHNYEVALARPVIQRAIGNTILIATMGGFVAMALSTIIGYLVVRSRVKWRGAIELIAWVPWAMPGIVLGLAMLWAYMSVPGLKSLYGTPWLLMLGQIVTVIPIGVRVMSSALRQVNRELEEAAQVHGAAWWQMMYWVLLRLTAPSFLYGWLVVGVIIAGEFAVPMLLYSPGSEVLSIAIFRLYADGRTEEAAAVFCVALAVIALMFAAIGVGRMVVERAARGLERGSARKDAAEGVLLAPATTGGDSRR